jgi:hypothetical protein
MSAEETIAERAQKISAMYTDGIVCLQEAANLAIGECAHSSPEDLVPQLNAMVSSRLEETIREHPICEQPSRPCPLVSDIPPATKENWDEYTDLVGLMYSHGEHSLTKYFAIAQKTNGENTTLDTNA